MVSIGGFIKLTGSALIGTVEIAGRTTQLFFESVLQLRHLPRSVPTLIRQLDFAGYGSILVLSLIAWLTGMIMAIQTGNVLQTYGVLDTLGAIIAASFTRELGPIWAAVIVLARVGSSMAAELGTMVVNEEVEALRVMGISPVRFLIMPRILALALVLPLLTIIADVVGILGGGFVTWAVFQLPFGDFLASAERFLTLWDFLSGLIKSFVFGCIIGTIACDQGLHTTNGAEGVGKATTTTVMLSVVFVLITDFIMTALMRHGM